MPEDFKPAPEIDEKPSILTANALEAEPAAAKPDDPDRQKALDSTAQAAVSGNSADLTKCVTDAYEKYCGVKDGFKSFGQALTQDLEKQGIVVKTTENSMSFHKQGSPDGVVFELKAELAGDKVVPTVKAQAYDFDSKEDITSRTAADVIKGLAGPVDPAALKAEKSLDWLRKLSPLQLNVPLADSSDDGRTTLDELKASKSSGDRVQVAIDNFSQLAHTAKEPGTKEVVLTDTANLDANFPELKADIKYAIGQFKTPRLTESHLTNQKNYLERMNSESARRVEVLADKASGAKGVVEAFDDLGKKYPPDANSVDKRVLLRADASKVDNADVKKALEYLKNSPSGLTDFDGNLTKERMQKTLESYNKSPGIFKNEIKDLENVVANFDELRKIAGDDGTGFSVTKLRQDNQSNDDSVKFLKGHSSEIDKDRNGIISKSEVETYKNGMDAKLAEEQATHDKGKALRDAELQSIGRLSDKFSLLSDATASDDLGISRQDVNAALDKAFVEAAIAQVEAAKNGQAPELTASVKRMFQEHVSPGASSAGIKSIVGGLNAKLKSSPYEYQVTVTKEDGPHGDTVRKATVSLNERKTGNAVYSFAYSVDTVR